ncbi:MAG: LytR/AlgR family response regulator transcription factor, partial [Pyrinomonadaceae bacterium]
QTKRYLHNETLKSILETLDNETFVRIHKSLIVNISNVRSYKSRLNGDYDLTVADGTSLRLSRTYAATFKEKFRRGHQDTTD